jgi:SulP family sulfate permease
MSVHGPSDFKGEVKEHVKWLSQELSPYKDPKKIIEIIRRELCIIDWVSSYKLDYLITDVAAGFCEGVMCVPQGIAYAALSGMPPVYGLYMGMMNPMIYSIFGQNKQGSHGVAAIECIIIDESINEIVGHAPIKPSKPSKTASADVQAAYQTALAKYNAIKSVWQGRKIRATVATTFVAGFIQLFLRFLGFGVFGNMLSKPILAGFSTGAAVIIATSQLKNLWVLNLPNLENAVELWIMVAEAWADGPCNWWPLLFMLLGWIFIYLMKVLSQTNRFTKKFPIPGALLCVILSIIICRQAHMYEGGPSRFQLPIVKTVPAGLPKGQVPALHEFGTELIGSGIKCGILFYIMSQAFAKAMAKLNNYETTGENELFSLAMVNIFCSFFQCQPSALSLSRTALMNGLGVKSQSHNIVCSIVVIVVLKTLTSTLYFLPKCMLTSIIYYALWHMICIKDFKELWHVSRKDFFFCFATCVLTILCGGVVGICTGIGIQLLSLLYQLTQPQITTLGRMPGTNVYRNVKRFPFCEVSPGIVIVRVDAPLNFSNIDYFAEKLHQLTSTTSELRSVVIDCGSVTDLDLTAVIGLTDIVKDFQSRGVQVIFANWHGPQRDMLEKTKFHEQISTDTLFLCLHDAVEFAKANPPVFEAIKIEETKEDVASSK